jgi:hypothetical protein
MQQEKFEQRAGLRTFANARFDSCRKPARRRERLAMVSFPPSRREHTLSAAMSCSEP